MSRRVVIEVRKRKREIEKRMGHKRKRGMRVRNKVLHREQRNKGEDMKGIKK